MSAQSEELKEYVDNEIGLLKNQLGKMMEHHERNSSVLDKILDTLLKEK